VEVSIYDPSEASAKFKQILGAGEYIVEARATLDRFSATLHLRLLYKVESAGVAQASPSQLFSKYLLWTVSQSNSTSGDTYVYESESDGYVHIEGDVQITNTNTKLGMPITATGAMRYVVGNTTYTAPTWDKFDANRNNVLDTLARPNRGNTSEADSKALSGGGKPKVPQPDYSDVESRFVAAAAAQSAGNPAMRALWIDPQNPEYAPGGSMYVGTLSHSTIKLAHDGSAGATTARIAVFGSAGSRSVDVVLPAGTPTIILTSARIEALSGTYYANLTVASTYSGTPTDITIYPGFPELPLLPTLGTPAITIDDHLICVDQAGRPKSWIYDRTYTTPTYYEGKVLRKTSTTQTQLPPDGDLMPTKGSCNCLPRPPAGFTSRASA
jgi:hypothetical protein